MANLEKQLTKQLADFRQIFSNYQMLPSFITDTGISSRAELDYNVNQLPLDLPRYKFLTSQLSCSKFSVVEVGSNLGFFCLSLAKDYNCRAIGFEPISQYTKAATIMAEIGAINGLCEFSDKSVTLQDIKNLPTADLYIELNVMHHAGVVFDKAQLRNFGSWKDYAIARLSEYRNKSQMLLFQTATPQMEKRYLLAPTQYNLWLTL